MSDHETTGPSGPSIPDPLPQGEAGGKPPRRYRWRRWALGILLALVLLVAAVAGLFWWGVATESGGAFLLSRLVDLVPGTITIGSQAGPVNGPLVLRDVRWEREGMVVTVERALLEWDLRDLRRRQLDIHRLHAEGVRIVLPPAQEDDTEDGRLVDVHLPVNIIVREGLVRNLEIVRPGEEPFRLDRIALDGRTRPGSDTLVVRSLAVDGPIFQLRAQGEVTPVGDYPVDLEVRTTYDPPEYPPFVVAGRLDGSLERLGIAARLTRPFDARVTGHLETPMRELGMDLAAQVRGFEAKEINPEWPVARVRQGDLTIKGKLDDFTSEGKIAGVYEDLGSGVATYRLARKGEEFFFEYLNVQPEAGGEISARGTVGTGGEELRLDVAADWSRLSWPLQGTPTVVSRSGEATVRGTLAEYQVEMNAHLAGPGIPPGRWALAGRGTQERMVVRSLRGDVLRGRLAAEGTISWQPRVEWRVAVDGRGIDPGAHFAGWPGRLSFAATSTGRLADAGPYGSVHLTDLDGQLRGNPVAGRIHLELRGDRYGLPRLDLRSGSARLTAAGSFSKDAGDLQWQLAAPNLGEALPDAAGSLQARGNVTGPWTAPRIAAQGTGDAVSWQTYSAEEVTLAADVDLSQGGPVFLDLDAASVGLDERRFETVALDARGTQGEHEIALAVRAEEGSLDLGAAGGFVREETRWSGEIRTLALDNEETGAWDLAGPAELTASPESAALSDFCWVSGEARLCAEGAWNQAGPWSASGTIADLPFSLFEPFLPPDLEITGDLDGTFAGQGSPAGVVTAEVDLRPGPGEIRYPLESGETAAVRFEEGEVVLDAGAEGVTGRAALTFVDTGTIRADLGLPQYNTFGAPLQQQSLNGRIVADFRDLGLVEAFVPDLEGPQGTLTADLALGGTVAEPRLTGAADLEGQVDVPRYGLELREIDLAARAEGDEPFSLRGSLRSGGGTLTLAGVAARDGQPARLSIQGRRVLAADTPELRVVVSPDLEAVLEGTALSVAGEVTVPEAEIVQQEREAAIPVSDDVVIVSQEQEVAAQGGQALEISARIRVILGEDVEVRASGFTGEVEGSLLLVEQPGRPTLGTGELVVENGTYKAYGQSLTLDRGRLIFAGGPIDNPGLDLRAFREADDGTIAGINVQGTLESPQTTLYSDPPMAQSEALAYLLLGRPLGQATPEEGDLLANAADTLGLKGGNLLAKRLAARFGLEEARVESEEGLEEARLVVGRYLSPRLYVTYGVGLFEPVNLLRLRYILGRDWSVQVETGEETRADVLYNVERRRPGTE